MALETKEEAATGEAWYASRGVMGSLLTGLVALLGAWLSLKGIRMGTNEQAALVEMILSLLGLIGAAVSWWGRVFATKQIAKQITIPILKPPTPSVKVTSHDLEG